MRICVSDVTLSVPCHHMRARVITIMLEILWRVTYGLPKIYMNSCDISLPPTLKVNISTTLQIKMVYSNNEDEISLS